jgi:hypothetical protein
MKIKIPKNILWQLLYVLCIAIPYLDNFEFTFFVWSLTFVLTICKKYSFDILAMVIPYFLILILAGIATFRYEPQFYFLIRDITYLTKPMIVFFVGYQLYKKNAAFAFKLIVYTGVFIAVCHIYTIVSAVVIYHARTVADLRFHSGYFSDYEIYVFIILLFHKQFGLNISKKKLRIFTIIVGFSAFMYLARTNFIQFGILYLALKGHLVINKKTVILYSTLILSGILAYSAILYYNPRRDAEGLEGMLYKIKVAPMEPFKTKIDRHDWKEFNDNYRSYENIMTIRQVTNEGWITTFFGKGLGSKIDLRQEVYLGDMELRFISILHNGFMIVFLKTGILGILIYLFTITFFFRKKSGIHPQIRTINLLFLGTGIFLLISNWVFLGFYNLTESKSILIGFLIAYRENLLKNEKHSISSSIR